MAAKNVLKNLNLFIEGRGHAGQLVDFTPPKLTLKLDEFRGGGMDAPVELDMGMDKLTATGTLKGFDPSVLALWGVVNGQSTRVVARGALEDFDGTVRPVVYTMAGRFTEMDHGTHKPGETSELKFSVSCVYYRYEHNGQTITEIDVQNMTRVINGVDQLKAKRQALGL